jgi:competence ComEA-like helix-hairpin-helix protein
MRFREERKNRTYAVAFAIASGAAMLLCAGLVLPRIGDSKAAGLELSSGVNPNDAPAGSLMRLPGIGPSRANAIISYRERFEAENGRRAFESPADLTKVKGIGPKTVEKMGPWLEF